MTAMNRPQFAIDRYKTDVKALLDQLAAKINAVGGATPILHSESDPELNLWAGNTTGNWDGYLDIYDPSTNPGGYWKNPGDTSKWLRLIKRPTMRNNIPFSYKRRYGSYDQFPDVPKGIQPWYS